MKIRLLSSALLTAVLPLAMTACADEGNSTSVTSTTTTTVEQEVAQIIQKRVGEAVGYNCQAGADSCSIEFTVVQLRSADSCEALGREESGAGEAGEDRLLEVEIHFDADPESTQEDVKSFMTGSSWSFRTADGPAEPATESSRCAGTTGGDGLEAGESMEPGTTLIRHELFQLSDEAVALRMTGPDSGDTWEWDLTDVEEATIVEAPPGSAEPIAPAAPASGAPVQPESPPVQSSGGSIFNPPGVGVQCPQTDAWVDDLSLCTPANLGAEPAPAPAQPAYSDPPRADGCVGPAAVCGYYDENGNPIWFDKQTLETSPRYYDEYGNPTMTPPQ